MLKTILRAALVMAALAPAALLAGAGLLFRVMRPRYGMLPASLGLVVVLFLPSLFYASISVLKEPLYFLASSICIAAAITLGRVRHVLLRELQVPVPRVFRQGPARHQQSPRPGAPPGPGRSRPADVHRPKVDGGDAVTKHRYRGCR